MSTLIRTANPATDFERIAELLTAIDAEPTSVEDLHEDEGRVVPGKLRRRFVATNPDGLITGYSLSVHYPSQGPGKFNIHVVVDAAWRRQGIGGQLYDAALAFVREQQGHLVFCEVQEKDPAALHFAQQRGFTVQVHEIGATLDLATYDESRHNAILADLAQQGIRFSTFSEEGDTPENRQRLYDINRIAVVDNPSSGGTFPTFEVWQRLVPEASDFQPDGQILALDSNRADGKYIGLTGIEFFDDANLASTTLTGVDAAYRGRGLALALKLHALRFAVARGATHVVTRVNEVNTPMLRINDRLGFERKPGYYELQLALD